MPRSYSDIKSLINRILEAEKERFSEKLIQEFRTIFVADFVEAFSRVYDQLLLSGGGLPEDPTSPENIKGEVIQMVRQRTLEAVERLSYSNGSIHIQGLNIADLGFYGGATIPKDYKDPPKNLLFAFYIVGMVADVVFISKSTFKKITGREKPLGRFGEGYLMDGGRYRRVLERQAKLGAAKKNLPPYEEVLHPFSGKGPINFFGILRDQIKLSKYVNAAVRKMSTK